MPMPDRDRADQPVWVDPKLLVNGDGVQADPLTAIWEQVDEAHPGVVAQVQAWRETRPVEVEPGRGRRLRLFPRRSG